MLSDGATNIVEFSQFLSVTIYSFDLRLDIGEMNDLSESELLLCAGFL